MTKGEVWKVFFDAYAAQFAPGVIDNVNDATSNGNLAGAMACYEAGVKVTDDLLQQNNDKLIAEINLDRACIKSALPYLEGLYENLRAAPFEPGVLVLHELITSCKVALSIKTPESSHYD